MFGRMTQRAHLHRLLLIATLHRSSLTRPSTSSHSTITTSSHQAPPGDHFIHADLGACVHCVIFVAVFFCVVVIARSASCVGYACVLVWKRKNEDVLQGKEPVPVAPCHQKKKRFVDMGIHMFRMWFVKRSKWKRTRCRCSHPSFSKSRLVDLEKGKGGGGGGKYCMTCLRNSSVGNWRDLIRSGLTLQNCLTSFELFVGRQETGMKDSRHRQGKVSNRRNKRVTHFPRSV